MDQKLVSYTDLTTTLRLISQGLDVSEFDTGNDLIDIKLHLDNQEEDPTALFQRLSVTNARGEQIPLAQLAELKPSFSVQQIEHYNLEREITVSADVREGTTATEAMAEIIPKIEKMNLPDGYKWSVGGEVEQQAESFGDLGTLFLACIVIIIILITVQFNSLSIPLIILTTVYLAAAGGVIGMFITRTPIGFMSVIGITALAGIVVRNGIVLIEFMEDARREGMDLTEAVLKATEARFRPILLTATAAIFGLLPVALIGDILFRPMAITIISGVIFSTVLTLLVVPSLYMVVAKLKDKRQQKKLDRQAKREYRDGSLRKNDFGVITSVFTPKLLKKSSQKEQQRRTNMDEKKLEVFPVAIRLFSDKGYHATSVEEIAKESGMAKGSFYKLFSSKEELLVEILLVITKQIKSGLTKIYSQTYDSAHEKLVDLIIVCFENILLNQQLLMDIMFAHPLFKNKETEKKAQQMMLDFHILD